MKKILLLIVAFFISATTLYGQTKAQAKIDSVKLRASSNEQTEKFKKNDSAYKQLIAKKTLERLKNDTADLKLTSCDFEKNASAMVITDEANMVFNGQKIFMERFKRIKIFNDDGKSQANIRLEYSNRFGAEHILAVVAETLTN